MVKGANKWILTGNEIQNKAVLTGLVGALLLFIKQVTDLFGLDLSTQLNQASAIIGAILTLLTGIGVITDPTSKASQIHL